MSAYREKVFKDLTMALGESIQKNVKTRADGVEGLELLGNFNNIFNNYDKIIEVLQKNQNKEKEIEK